MTAASTLAAICLALDRCCIADVDLTSMPADKRRKVEAVLRRLVSFARLSILGSDLGTSKHSLSLADTRTLAIANLLQLSPYLVHNPMHYIDPALPWVKQFSTNSDSACHHQFHMAIRWFAKNLLLREASNHSIIACVLTAMDVNIEGQGYAPCFVYASCTCFHIPFY